ncbi:MAG: 50S ribosomal protein L4 [Candidatus Woesearchaeota archaeon]
MKLTIRSMQNTSKGQQEMPIQFSEPLREDIIKKAVLALQAGARQPYGSFKEAGQQVSAKLSRRRRDYRGAYGIGISRVPRKIMSRRGTRMNWVGALAPGTVGGRRAHPPKAEKIWDKKVNKKENRLAIRSAMSATLIPEVVKARGHIPPKEYPFIIESGFENIQKTAEAWKTLDALGFADELARTEKPTRRTGRARTRGRQHKIGKSILIVTAQEAPVMKALNNIPGVDCVAVHALNAELLAPGTHHGRITLFTETAIKRLIEEGLFLNVPPAKQRTEKIAEPKRKAASRTKKAPVKKTVKKAVKKPTKKVSK